MLEYLELIMIPECRELGLVVIESTKTLHGNEKLAPNFEKFMLFCSGYFPLYSRLKTRLVYFCKTCIMIEFKNAQGGARLSNEAKAKMFELKPSMKFTLRKDIWL